MKIKTKFVFGLIVFVLAAFAAAIVTALANIESPWRFLFGAFCMLSVLGFHEAMEEYKKSKLPKRTLYVVAPTKLEAAVWLRKNSDVYNNENFFVITTPKDVEGLRVFSDEVIFVDHARCDPEVLYILENNWVALAGKLV